ncbi:response regulator [Paenibacillus sp. HB172176]|uniref:response regulator n=1 Tax=Paenibacillus sp. HB172176 TaxID=2493690 RepID=UPI001438F8B7|nr:response regulator [Paenibacillus sp. HB172176]
MKHEERISLCIIDDIRSVVEGLSSLDWEEQGIEMIGTAYNGEDGLALIQEKSPDIIVTDIRMPRMDGLTMLRAVLEHNQACKMILISSYTDFDYAREAIKLGAFDFVVKPFTEEDILAAAVKARNQIIEERNKLLNVEAMERKLRESFPLLRQEYVSLLLSLPVPWSQASERWAYLDMQLAPENIAVMQLEIDGFQEQIEQMSVHERELTRFTLQNIVEETLNEHTRSLVFRFKQNRFVAMMNASHINEGIAWAEQCCRNIEQFTKFTISIGVGGVAAGISGLPESCSQAERALLHHLYTSGNGVISYEDVSQMEQPITVTLDYKDELLLVLRAGNAAKAGELLANMAKSLQELSEKPNPDYLLSLYEELAAAAMRIFHELIPYPEIQPLADRFKRIQQATGLAFSALQQQLEALCREGAELVRKSTMSEGQSIIYKSIEYLNEHLHREVTVSECASQVHLSASYYSSLFKKIMGMTITQYMTAERIRIAKSLLVGGTPVQEVAAAVGYEERRYFSDMFKRTTGMTPSEFRDSYHAGGATDGIS